MVKHLDAIQHEMTGAENVEKITGLVASLNAVRSHYAKKEELLMPLLYDYGVTGPSQVMWGVDDEIKRELGTITKALKEDAENYPLYKGRINQVCTRIREMVFKEDRILFPLSLRYLTQEQWCEVYRDLFEMGMAFVDAETMPRWPEGEAWLKEKSAQNMAAVLDGKVKLPTGELTVRQLQGILKLLDVDITFIDKDDILRYFLNEGKVFRVRSQHSAARSTAAIRRKSSRLCARCFSTSRQRNARTWKYGAASWAVLSACAMSPSTMTMASIWAQLNLCRIIRKHSTSSRNKIK